MTGSCPLLPWSLSRPRDYADNCVNMRNPPPSVIASWPTANYVNPVSRGPALLIVELTIGSIAIVTLLARLYVRIFKVNKSGLDDWLMLAAMVSPLSQPSVQPRSMPQTSTPWLSLIANTAVCSTADIRHWRNSLCYSLSPTLRLEYPCMGSSEPTGCEG